MINKTVGNQFEREFCETLSDAGFWVHNFTQNSSGQPADVIAVREGNAFLIDCKVCTHNSFSLSRIEENQSYSMEKWNECMNGIGLFALRVREGEVYILGYPLLRDLSYRQSKLSYDEIVEHGTPLKEWLK